MVRPLVLSLLVGSITLPVKEIEKKQYIYQIKTKGKRHDLPPIVLCILSSED
ncbi:Uncharacterised protein [Legionella quateirensis]|uniref:Uncharacterized protein n=1 Tax=Legionella quateirensis TaxID=45072 RepID=A0A378L2K1_9GAMM|nr:hypothetical protein Lqua_1859 [Legionella quateirensis]STY18340.1 Uncharacterised protein [Legionella quateirensis]